MICITFLPSFFKTLVTFYMALIFWLAIYQAMSVGSCIFSLWVPPSLEKEEPKSLVLYECGDLEFNSLSFSLYYMSLSTI